MIIVMTSYLLQEMEMGEKPKKAPEQTAMVKMGMLGTSTIFTTVIFTTIHHHDQNNPPRGGVHALPPQHLGGDALLEVNPLNFSQSRFGS